MRAFTNYQKFLKQIEYVKTLDYKPTLLLHCCCGPCSCYPLIVLKDYFDIKSMPELSLTKDGNAYLIEINLVATRVKTFGVLPRV